MAKKVTRNESPVGIVGKDGKARDPTPEDIKIVHKQEATYKAHEKKIEQFEKEGNVKELIKLLTFTKPNMTEDEEGKERQHGYYAHIKSNAAEALGRLKSKEAVPALIKMLKDPDNGMDDLSPPREQAAWALGEIGDKRAINPLKELIERADSIEMSEVAYVYNEAKTALEKLANKK